MGRAGELDAAIAEFKQSGGEATAHYNLGVIIYENALDQSRAQFEKALSLDPHFSEAKIWSRYVQGPQDRQIEPQIVPAGGIQSATNR